MAIQDEVIITRNYQRYILKDLTEAGQMLKMWKTRGNYTAYHRSRQLERHDSVGKVIHSALVRMYFAGGDTEPYYRYNPSRIQENDEVAIYQDRTLYTSKSVAHNSPDIPLKDKKWNRAHLIDIAVPNVNNMIKYKISKYAELAYEVRRQWKMEAEIVPVVISTTGIVLQITTKK